MFKALYLLPIILFISCSDPDSTFDVSAGEAVITLDNTEYNAEAKWGERIFGEDLYQEVHLDMGEDGYADILCLRFEEGPYVWDGETHRPDGAMVFLTTQNHGGGGFGPTGGFLIIHEITETTISGTFHLDMYNFASSCWDCPENELDASGKFVAIVNLEG